MFLFYFLAQGKQFIKDISKRKLKQVSALNILEYNKIKKPFIPRYAHIKFTVYLHFRPAKRLFALPKSK